MSASRAIASAKNKKAGGNNPNPAVSTPEQYSPNVGASAPSSAPGITKVTIPQALQMLAGRVDLMEEKLSKAFEALEDSRILEKQSENKYLVDAQVFDSLVSRIEELEAKPKANIDVPTQHQPENTVSKHDLNSVHANIAGLTNRMVQFKDDFIKLQSYVMDTNAKLTEVVFSIPAESMVDYRDIFVKKTEDLSDPSVFVPVHRMTSTPDISELAPEPMDTSCLERPVLTRQTNQLMFDDELESNIKNEVSMTNIEELNLKEHKENVFDNEENAEMSGL
jgi:hypothetical protein